jgi:hypothetical protein
MQAVKFGRHLLADFAASPVLLVARTLSYLLGNHSTFSAFRLGAEMSARSIEGFILTALVGRVLRLRA